MSDPLLPVAMAVSGGAREPIGWFRYAVASDTWTWSEELFQIHGFEPGEIVPTSDVFAAHKHPEDRSHTDEVLAAVLATGEPYCCRHRIIDSQHRIRTVITIGQGTLDETGKVTQVHGYFVDISNAGREAAQHEVTEALHRADESRADIEQAKGALMLVHAISADDAFAILRWHSSHANMKLRDLARLITASISAPGKQSETPSQRISRILGGVVTGYSDKWLESVAVPAKVHVLRS